MSDDDDIIKVCQIQLLDDNEEAMQLMRKHPQAMLKKLEAIKEKGLKIIEMYASLSKS